MAQNPKATEHSRLMAAVTDATRRVAAAKAAHTETPSLKNLRAQQVASDALAECRKALRIYETARDPEAVRRSDANPRRAHASWPVGKTDDPRRPIRRKAPRPVNTTPLPPPPPSRPNVLATRTVEVKGKEEHLSWWVGIDRTTLTDSSKVLATVPRQKTAEPVSRQTIKTASQRENDAKRDARKQELSGRLQDKLKPMAGAFSVIPMAD